VICETKDAAKKVESQLKIVSDAAHSLTGDV
jgi:hypothetical protein